MTRGAVICVNHGSGPMPVLGDEYHTDVTKSLQETIPRILRLGTPEAPRAILVITAHWSENYPTVSSADKHELYYDYRGFPPQSYSLKYDAPGSRRVAEEVGKALENEGLRPVLDDKRGWDHGVFIPFMLINPLANVPLVQISVLLSENAQDHLNMGRAFEKLRDSNIAILGSGFSSVHNLPVMLKISRGFLPMSSFQANYEAWNKSLTGAVLEENADERCRKLEKWRGFPHSDEMHPPARAEHFLPLLVCAGAAGDEKGEVLHDKFGEFDIYSYYWS
ncbi:conserved hypothetical protein [Talaromyces stipitatus ATCC 10500]|uniref:Extradiol ring-cleavage dioxygenase class III enzyme subunit B domain-containing protein n=1 Tax=Talaromyces stipitatus (strain ATCC 10500 / CBS 375.48 / QM 6759 / NRRL 1006) TaxID=441959 RepID=B8LV97_TALSN|nr:uncharacterized protein TSTA_066000 [Talaromyces stipitatus ATCC 10500]EED23147.1 conserved hypothetical protein [Talaromyces stipitatus ATCC 10500]